MLKYAVIHYRHAHDKEGVEFSVHDSEKDAIETAELSYAQVGNLWCVEVKDIISGRRYDTVYVCGVA